MDRNKLLPFIIIAGALLLGAIVYAATQQDDGGETVSQEQTNQTEQPTETDTDTNTDGSGNNNGQNSNTGGDGEEAVPAVTKIRVPYVRLEGGTSGNQIGCGDKIEFIEYSVPATTQPLRATYEKLLSEKASEVGSNKLYNSLSRSSLKFESATVENGKATVRLSGNYMLGGTCDDPRFQAQLKQAALQFETVESAEVLINGKSIESIMQEQAN